MPDAYTWQIRLRRRGELEPRLVETRQETRKPQLLETINLHLPDGPAVRAMIVYPLCGSRAQSSDERHEAHRLLAGITVRACGRQGGIWRHLQVLIPTQRGQAAHDFGPTRQPRTLFHGSFGDDLSSADAVRPLKKAPATSSHRLGPLGDRYRFARCIGHCARRRSPDWCSRCRMQKSQARLRHNHHDSHRSRNRPAGSRLLDLPCPP